MRLALLVMCLLGVSGIADAQDAFPDVPEIQTEWRLNMKLRPFGFEDARHGAMSGPPARLSEIARVLIDGIDRLPQLLTRGFEYAIKPRACSTPLGVVSYTYAGFKNDVPRFVRESIKLLRPEITKLGRDPDLLLKQVDDFEKGIDKVAQVWIRKVTADQKPPFADVPISHWAFAAVQELRDAGILAGYPDGLFRG